MRLDDPCFNSLDDDSQRSISNLLKDTQNKEITLVCGAGVSVSAGLPSWNKYLKKIVSTFLVHWSFQERVNVRYKDVAPRQMSLALLEDVFEKEFLDPEIAENFLREDPLILAQLIKNCIEPANWRYLLRKSLYEYAHVININDELISSITNLIVENQSKFSSILTYNYDDIIETRLKTIGIKSSPIIGENYFRPHPHYPIYHVHGFLPIKGGLNSKIYLSEEDYLTDIIQPNSWYNQLHSNKLTSTCCLFIGLSFNDPSVKRKLAVHRLNPNHFHYALLTHGESEFEKKKFLLLKNELLRLNVRVIKYKKDSNSDNPHKNLTLLIDFIYKYST